MALGMPERPASCRRCSFIRWFLGFSAALIGLMLFASDQVGSLGAKLPSPEFFGWLVPSIGIPGFLLRYITWVRNGRP